MKSLAQSEGPDSFCLDCFCNTRRNFYNPIKFRVGPSTRLRMKKRMPDRWTNRKLARHWTNQNSARMILRWRAIPHMVQGDQFKARIDIDSRGKFFVRGWPCTVIEFDSEWAISRFLTWLFLTWQKPFWFSQIAESQILESEHSDREMSEHEVAEPEVTEEDNERVNTLGKKTVSINIEDTVSVE